MKQNLTLKPYMFLKVQVLNSVLLVVVVHLKFVVRDCCTVFPGLLGSI